MTRKAVLTTVLAVLLVFAPLTGVVGAAPASGGTDGTTDQSTGIEWGQPGPVDPALQDADGTVEVVFRLESIDRASLQGVTGQAATRKMKQHAWASQQDLLRFAAQTDGIKVINRLWIANAVLAKVDTDEVSIQRVTQIKGVDRAHANFQLTIPDFQQEAASGDGVQSNEVDTTYGLEQINATKVWDEYNTQGEGVGVAVLDTGVDPDHPDIDIQDENFVKATSDGEIENVDPYDSDNHGTHVSGTVVGGNASGEYIGVAPEATLYHGLVIPGGGGSFAQVAAGMQWAANQSGVDVVSMSLGAPGYGTQLIEPVQNIEAAGKILVASISNSGEGSSGNPGNIYETIAAGASNEAGEIAGFSSGELIDTSADWGSAAPSDWPEEYYVPDYAAPGVAVKSSVPGGEYAEFSGTSMAAPHISGAIALMLSVSGDLDAQTVQDALTETAWAPVEDPPQDRYGDGIIDIYNATQMVALEQEITGTVTDADGNPIEGASVTTDQGFEATTNAEGEYTVLAETGNVSVTASAFGAESSTQTVEVGDNETVTLNFSLSPALDVALESGQPSAIEGGQNASATATAANLESYTAELADGFSEANATLYVNGQEAEFGTPITFDEPTDVTATVTVETANGSSGSLSVVHTFEGLGDSVEVTTGPTEVFAEFLQVGVVSDSGDYAGQIVETLNEQLPANYAVDVLSADEAIESTDEYDSYVVNNIDEANADAFVEATAGYSVGVVYLDQWGSDSNAIEARSAALGDPGSTDDGFSGENPTLVNVDSDHPIFEGVGEEPILLHTASFPDKMWFSDTDAQVLADVSNGEVQGAAVAIDSERWDILAGSFGYELFVQQEDYTEEADIILGNMVEIASNPPEPAGTVKVTETTVTPGSSAEVHLQTDVSNVTGYEATITFDPDKLQVASVSGEDLADPVVTIDNEEGEIVLTQAQATGVDAPKLAEITFDVVGLEAGEETELNLLSSETEVFDPNGDAYITNYDDGSVSVLEGQLGDVDADGEITAGDAVVLQRYIAGLPTEVPNEQIEALGDVNQDGEITAADVTYILQIVAGIEEPPEMNSGSESKSSVAPPTLERTEVPSAAIAR
jgi:subtilisin family serine protease